MSKITTRLSFAIAATLLSSGAAMAQGSDFASMVVDYGYAPGLGGKTVTAASQPVADKAPVAQATASKTRAEVIAELAAAQTSTANADAEMGFTPAARKQTSADTVMAGK